MIRGEFMSALTDARITTNWNEIDNFHKTPHKGIDFATKTGTKIIAQDSGQIQLTTDKFIGNAIRLKMKNGDTVVYGHVSEYKVYDGQIVNAGDLLGLTGGAVGSKNSGLTTGEHCHVSLWHEGVLVSPYDYLFHHQTITQSNNNSSPLIIPVILILLFVVFFKYRRIFLYITGILFLLGIIFIVS